MFKAETSVFNSNCEPELL